MFDLTDVKPVDLLNTTVDNCKLNHFMSLLSFFFFFSELENCIEKQCYSKKAKKL